MLDIEPSETDAIITGASELWARFYGVVRASGSDRRARRVDAGCPKPEKKCSTKPSLAGWLADRNENVGRKTASLHTRPSLELDDDGDTLWTESHDKELKFQKDDDVSQLSCVGLGL